VFVLFEAHLLTEVPSQWARQFLTTFPEARRLYRSRQDVLSAYGELAQLLAERGFRYRWVGVKQPDLDALFLGRIQAASVVYCVRDVRTWLVKRHVQTGHFIAIDVVPAATALTAGLIESFELPRFLHVTTEDLILDNAAVQQRFASFLGLECSGPVAYWEVLPPSNPADPKQAIGWMDYHQSSGIRPQQLDVTTRIRGNAFWDVLLPVFDQYYAAAAGRSAVPDQDQRRRDLDEVHALARRFQLPFADAFESVVDDTVRRPASRLRAAGSLAKQAARVLALGPGR
jgi:hypothetical protein